MKNKIFIIPGLVFFLILLIFFYLLTMDRNPSEIPSNLINKNVPNFKADTLLKKKKIYFDRRIWK